MGSGRGIDIVEDQRDGANRREFEKIDALGEEPGLHRKMRDCV